MKDCTCSGLRLKLTFMQTLYLQVVNRLPNSDPILNGIESNLLNSLASTLNFTYDLHETESGQYGKLLPNKSWTGVVGRLAAEKADFCISALSVTEGRRTVIDFSVPYIHDTLRFYVGVENGTRSKVLFLSPFNVNLWLVEVTCTILVSILLYICYTFRHKPPFKMSSFMVVFGIAAKQGVNLKSIQQPASFMIISLLITCTITNIFYGNELKASTSVPTKNDINTLDDLASVLRLGTMNFYIPEHSSILEYIAKMPPTPYGDLFRRVTEIRPRRPSNNADIYARRITTTQSRIRMELELLKLGYPPSKIRAVSEPLASLNTAIGFRKNFTCQGSFNWVIIALSESGCLQKWQEELMFPVTMEEMKNMISATEVNYIGFIDLKTTFGLLFISYFASLVVIAIQHCKILLVKCFRKILFV